MHVNAKEELTSSRVQIDWQVYFSSASHMISTSSSGSVGPPDDGQGKLVADFGGQEELVTGALGAL